MTRAWGMRVLEPNDLVALGVKHLRHLQAQGHGKIVCEHADAIEGIMGELAARFLDLRSEVDTGMYNKSNWPPRPQDSLFIISGA